MKRFKLSLAITAVGTVLMIIGGVILAWVLGGLNIALPKPVLLAMGGSVMCGGLALIIVGFIMYKTPDKARKQRMTEYRELVVSPLTDFKAELDGVRANFAADTNPKKNRTMKPKYLGSERLYDFGVLRNGFIRYGYLVQANSNLFNKKISAAQSPSLPAVVVFSPDEYFEREPMKLREIAHGLFADKNNNILKNESRYFSNIKVPLALTNGREVYTTTLILFREHMPLRYLTGSLFPVITNPATSTSTFMVDCKYWTDNLIANFIHNFPYNND